MVSAMPIRLAAAFSRRIESLYEEKECQSTEKYLLPGELAWNEWDVCLLVL